MRVWDFEWNIQRLGSTSGVDGKSDWEQVEWFAGRGVIVTPGRFYGEAGIKHIRIALTASDEAIERVIERVIEPVSERG